MEAMRAVGASLPSFLVSVALLVAASGCDCEGDLPLQDVGGPCDTAADCRSGLLCRDGTCRAGPDAGPMTGDGGLDAGADAGECEAAQVCGGGTMCCPDGEECVDDFACAPVCENTRCGDNNLTCCDAAQICLDGVVCAADCAADRALCGAALDTCCDAGDVCVADACATPGETCGDDFDCLVDDTYCEPTIGRCLPNPAPPLCEVRPDFEDVEIEVEWHWEGVTVGGERFNRVIAPPAVGDVSGDGVPDVVVPVYTGASGATTVLVAIDGGTGTLHWSVGPGTDEPQWTAMVALGDLDPSDDALEIVYRTQDDGLVVLDGDGTTVLARSTTGSGSTTGIISPTLADLDGDGVVEVLAGCQAFSFEMTGGAWTLRERFDAGACNAPSQSFASVAVANLDADAELELTTGGAAYDTDGSLMWPPSGETPLHGFPAVADLDLDGAPEVISLRQGAFTIRDGATGAMRVGPGGTWLDAAVGIPGGGLGGAPTVADFDGDGLPEVSTAGRGCYVVYDVDCMTTPPRAGGDCTRPADDPTSTCDDDLGELVRWARPTQDISSSVTGSSVFDFQGDGVSEVVYNDECFLHVYDGNDGRELLSTPRPNSSRTGLEYPLVVDVDRDGNSEIVVPANDDQAVTRDDCPTAYAAALGVPVDMLPAEFANGTFGIYAFGDPMDRWVRTRPIWNQFTYHVTNVGDRGAIPMTEADNWTTAGLNNYRQNVQGEGVFNAPNLTVTLEAVALCGAGDVRLSAVVTNAGSRGVPAGVLIEFVQTAPTMATIATAMTTGPLLPGASERVTVLAEDVEYDVDLAYEVRVDGAAATTPIVECDEDDNTASTTERCMSLL